MTPLIQMTTERGYAMHIHADHTELFHKTQPNQVFRGPKHRSRAVELIAKEKGFEQSSQIRDGAVGP